MMNSLKTEMKEKGVFLITLNRPKVLNSLNKEIIDELLEAFDVVYADQSIRTVVLTGEGRGFCSGADLAGGGWPSDPSWSPGESKIGRAHVRTPVTSLSRMPSSA